VRPYFLPVPEFLLAKKCPSLEPAALLEFSPTSERRLPETIVQNKSQITNQEINYHSKVSRRVFIVRRELVELSYA